MPSLKNKETIMNSLTDNFNQQANWYIFILPLWVLLILDDIERRNKRRKRILSLKNAFNDAAIKKPRKRNSCYLIKTPKR